jgi:hypothetical protein
VRLIQEGSAVKRKKRKDFDSGRFDDAAKDKGRGGKRKRGQHESLAIEHLSNKRSMMQARHDRCFDPSSASATICSQNRSSNDLCPAHGIDRGRYAPALRELRPIARLVKFTAPPHALLVGRLRTICLAENMPVDSKGLTMLSETAEGDMRSCLNTLQVGCVFVSTQRRCSLADRHQFIKRNNV